MFRKIRVLGCVCFLMWAMSSGSALANELQRVGASAPNNEDSYEAVMRQVEKIFQLPNGRRAESHKEQMKILGNLEKKSMLGDRQTQVLLGAYYLGKASEQDEKSPRSLRQDVLHDMTQAASQGSLKAQLVLGHVYSNRDFQFFDENKAMTFYELAAQQDNPTAQYELGRMYEEGRGASQDYAKAAMYYELAAEQDMGRAQLALVRLHIDGKVTRDATKLNQYLSWLEDKPGGFADYYRGVMYERGVVMKQDYSRANTFYELAAMERNSGARVALAGLYERGQGVPKNSKIAQKLLQSICRQDTDGQCVATPDTTDDETTYDVDTLMTLADFYERGVLYQDANTSQRYYHLAAQAGNPKAQYKMALILLNKGKEHETESASEEGGESATKSKMVQKRILKERYQTILNYLTSAVDQGYSNAVYALADIYLGQEQEMLRILSLKVDVNRALSLYALEADRGSERAIRELAQIYQRGDHVPHDSDKAMHYYKLLADKGNKNAMLQIGVLSFYRAENGSNSVYHYQQARHYAELMIKTPDPEDQRDAFMALSMEDRKNAFFTALGRNFFYIVLGRIYKNGLGTDKDYARALAYFELALEQDSAVFLELGEMYEKGLGVEQDYKKAIEYYERAERGDQYRLGLMYFYGLGVEKDDAKARDLLSDYDPSLKFGQVEAGHVNHVLGLMHEQGLGGEKDEAEAEDYYRSAVRFGYAPSMLRLAQLYEQGRGVDRSLTNAMFWARLACDRGQQDACVYQKSLGVVTDFDDKDYEFKVGQMYFYGKSSQRDASQAWSYFKRAHELGNTNSAIYMGYMLKQGYGIKQDYRQAVKYFTEALEYDEEGYAPAVLGVMHHYGLGVEQDYQQAITYYEQAQDNKTALEKLATMYYEGVGVAQDYQKAYAYYQRLGQAYADANALLKMSQMRALGQGVDKDTLLATELCQQASYSDSGVSCSDADDNDDDNNDNEGE